MKFSMTGQEKVSPFNTGDCLIEVTAWTYLTTYIYKGFESFHAMIVTCPCAPNIANSLFNMHLCIHV